MQFRRAGLNLILLISCSLTLLLGDLYLFTWGRTTVSEAIWTINQKSLAFAFIAGLVCGHCFTVPKGVVK